jgi:hypothetical protein
MPQPGGYIGFNRVPSTSAASGIWSVRDAERFRRASTWPGAITPDPDFASVSLLLHMDGSGSSFVDSSSNNLTVTANGVTQTTAQSKFGGKSGDFGGSETLTVPAGSDFAYGTGDFTIEAWIYRTSAGSEAQIFAQTESGTNYVLFGVNSSDKVFFVGTDSGGGAAIEGPAGNLVDADEWHHVAVVRASGDVTVYCDGVGGTATENTTDFDDTTRVPTVGSYTHSSSASFVGYIDEFRVTKGVARYTANFTPPTTPFANE